MTRIAVGVPACDEADRIVACVAALLNQNGGGPDVVVVFANNCQDDTAALLRSRFGHDPRLDLREACLPPPFNHVGWARRLAMDAAADRLDAEDDILLTTDADTVVAGDWIDANLRALEKGCDAVAGAAHLIASERAELSAQHRRRLLTAGKYFTLLAYLRAEQAQPHDPWPRHDYEGGASIALRLGMYRAIGGAPILPSGEDRALFDAVRRHGGRIRHAVDARVFTSCRLSGRAKGGTADTLGLWGELSPQEPAHGIAALDEALSGQPSARQISFQRLDRELVQARVLARTRRSRLALDDAVDLGLMSADMAPEVEPIRLGSIG